MLCRWFALLGGGVELTTQETHFAIISYFCRYTYARAGFSSQEKSFKIILRSDEVSILDFGFSSYSI